MRRKGVAASVVRQSTGRSTGCQSRRCATGQPSADRERRRARCRTTSTTSARASSADHEQGERITEPPSRSPSVETGARLARERREKREQNQARHSPPKIADALISQISGVLRDSSQQGVADHEQKRLNFGFTPPPITLLGLKGSHACARTVAKTVGNLSFGRSGSVRAVEVAVAEPKKSARRIRGFVPQSKS